ncbi:MAG: hypothetical protein PHQ35_09595 [Phycisphaerae bacterium]|nr:hypothetical protein [Phycisphaerae bacterium]MDD5239969.1 hypothetical protein [Candidatus Nanoarchaeia archaeon]
MGFWESKDIKHTRKEHKCEYCGCRIPAGSSCRNEVGTYEGDFNHYYLCNRCLVFWDKYGDKSSDELGKLEDDLIYSDLMRCPICKKDNERNYKLINNKQAIAIECDNCNHKWTVDLSFEALSEVTHESQIREQL